MKKHQFLQLFFGFFSIIGYILTVLRGMSEKGFDRCQAFEWISLVFGFILLGFLVGFCVGTRFKNE
jgi:hypothetical protein